MRLCSGQLFISSDFEITVAFEKQSVEGNSVGSLLLPESHTCVSTHSTPEEAYGGRANILEDNPTMK